MNTRKYQTQAVRNLQADLAEHRRVLAVAPTGSGKTVIAAMLINAESRWKKVLWLAHRYELVDQAYATLVDLGLDAGIVMAQEESLRGTDRVRLEARVQVASVQTISARGFDGDVDLIVIDEAHRAMAATYQDIAAQFPGSEVLGLTATPCRMDGHGLGRYFTMMRTMAQYGDLQADGYLAKPVTYTTPADVRNEVRESLSGATIANGDYSSRSMSQAVDKKALIGKVVEETLRIAPGVPKAVFCCSVAHSRRVAMAFTSAGVVAVHIDGKTPAPERESALNGLRDGAIEVICNVDVLSEGWDLPSLGAVVVARPTRSVGRFLQMVGRSMRKFGDARPVVIDHGDNIERLDVIPGEDIKWELTHGVPTKNEDEHKARVCDECGAVMERGELICQECNHGHEYRQTAAEERDALDVQLEEVTRADLESRRARLAAIRGRAEDRERAGLAPSGFADKLMEVLSG